MVEPICLHGSIFSQATATSRILEADGCLEALSCVERTVVTLDDAASLGRLGVAHPCDQEKNCDRYRRGDKPIKVKSVANGLSESTHVACPCGLGLHPDGEVNH